MKVSVLVKSVGTWLMACLSAADAEGKAPRAEEERLEGARYWPTHRITCVDAGGLGIAR